MTVGDNWQLLRTNSYDSFTSELVKSGMLSNKVSMESVAVGDSWQQSVTVSNKNPSIFFTFELRNLKTVADETPRESAMVGITETPTAN
uniref:Uncharacterized protein n=1 Tax=Romanomermis culicivorax TaxID=13658 RepID=A0A915KMF9_ROMCU